MRSDLIFDVGLHKGEDTSFYLKKGFSVVAVEAHPDLAREVARRLSTYVTDGQLIIVNKAIAKQDGEVRFFANQDESIWGTTSPSLAERNQRKGAQTREITVPGTRFANLISTHGIPYYLKVDIEGADRLCLEGLADLNLALNELPQFISIESSKTAFSDVVEEFALLHQLGYTKFKVVPQHRVMAQRLPNPPLEGRYVEHRFEEGSSGAFGLELPGTWADMDTALQVYRKIFLWYKVAGDDAMLTRFVHQNLRRRQPAEAPEIPDSREPRPSRLSPLGMTVRAMTRWLQPGWYDTHAMR